MSTRLLSMYNIKIPLGASTILDTLGKQGFEAYVVGGCARDSLLWLTPKDWDICTAATPQEVESCFDGPGFSVGFFLT